MRIKLLVSGAVLAAVAAGLGGVTLDSTIADTGWDVVVADTGWDAGTTGPGTANAPQQAGSAVDSASTSVSVAVEFATPVETLGRVTSV